MAETDNISSDCAQKILWLQMKVDKGFVGMLATLALVPPPPLEGERRESHPVTGKGQHLEKTNPDVRSERRRNAALLSSLQDLLKRLNLAFLRRSFQLFPQKDPSFLLLRGFNCQSRRRGTGI